MKREKAIKLRKGGLTYNQISETLKVPKSTLCSWFKLLPFNDRVKKENYSKAQTKWAEALIKYNKGRAKISREKSSSEQIAAEKEIKEVSADILKIIGICLYWAEGYKKGRWSVIFSNSDPNMIKIMMRFFLEICLVDKKKIKGQIQIHKNVTEKEANEYWQKISGISINNFRKAQKIISKSSKGKRRPNTLPYGTFRIIINDVKIVNLIKGWINGLIKQT